MPKILVATFNSQGSKWDIVRNLLAKCDVVVVQECGTLPLGVELRKEVYEDTECSIGYYTWGNFLVLHCAWGVGHSRCSMAIVCKEIPSTTPRFYGRGSELASRRPLVGLEIAPSVFLLCMHLVSSASAAQSATEMISAVASTTETWACFADYNCEPRTLDAFGPKCKIAPPSRQTHTGGLRLDYATYSGKIRCEATAVSGENGGSDHFPSLFEVEY